MKTRIFLIFMLTVSLTLMEMPCVYADAPSSITLGATDIGDDSATGSVR